MAVDTNGPGYLAGELPDGRTTASGVPVSAQVMAFYELPSGDWQLAASTTSAADGTWECSNLNPDYKFNVVGRHEGYYGVVAYGVTPVPLDVIAIESNTFTVNAAINGVDGALVLYGGKTPYTVTLNTPLPAGLLPVVDGHKIIVDGISSDEGEWRSEWLITSANGVTLQVGVVAMIGLNPPAGLTVHAATTASGHTRTLFWNDRCTFEQAYVVYRSENPISASNLPIPLATIAPGETSYVDDTASIGDEWYYAVATQYGASLSLSAVVFSKPWRNWRVVTKKYNGTAEVSCAKLTMLDQAAGADQCFGGVAKANSEWSSNYKSEYAFDEDGNTFWAAANVAGSTYWLGYQFSAPVHVNAFTWKARPDTWAYQQVPIEYAMQASDDGVVWVDQWIGILVGGGASSVVANGERPKPARWETFGERIVDLLALDGGAGNDVVDNAIPLSVWTKRNPANTPYELAPDGKMAIRFSGAADSEIVSRAGQHHWLIDDFTLSMDVMFMDLSVEQTILGSDDVWWQGTATTLFVAKGYLNIGTSGAIYAGTVPADFDTGKFYKLTVARKNGILSVMLDSYTCLAVQYLAPIGWGSESVGAVIGGSGWGGTGLRGYVRNVLVVRGSME